MHPAVALAEHFDEQVLHLLPVVVTPQQQGFDSFAQDLIGLADFLEGLAGCAAIEFVGLLGDAQAAAERRE